MLLRIPDVLTPEQVARCRQLLDMAEWVDGNVTSGHQSARAKINEQIPEEHPAAREMGAMILQALSRDPRFIAGALPQHVFPPLFNRYGIGQTFGLHVDNAVRQHRHSGLRVRTDLSATLFLAGSDEYDGGELVVEDTYGTHSVKLPAGHMVLYPSSSLHRVTPVTRGARLASFFWIQSMVRDDGERTLLFELDQAIQRLAGEALFELDQAIQRLAGEAPDHPSALQLTGIYHNLLRRWAEV